jgi:DNA-binding transcriptional LysR family regulator
MLDFELLRAFVAVADCGGHAAERLNLTQSTISQASVRGAEQTPGEHDVKPSR